MTLEYFFRPSDLRHDPAYTDAKGGKPMKRLFLFVLSLALAATAGAATITVTAPKDYPLYTNCLGNILTVKCTMSGTMPNAVKITLRDAVSLTEVAIIADNVPNSGEYSLWKIPMSTAVGKFKVRVKAVGAAVHGDSDSFTIEKCPALMLTDPSSSSHWKENTTHLITWNTSGPILPRVSLFLLNGQKQQVLVIAQNTTNMCQYSWKVPGNIKVGTYYVLLKSATTADESTGGPFSIIL
jgi:hypothetical protein